MAGIERKESLDFKFVGRRSVYQSVVNDQNGNVWRITVDGIGTLARQFIKELALELSAEPISPQEAEELIKAARERAIVAEPSDFPSKEPPSVRVTIALVDRIGQGPYRMKFIIDPSIWSGKNPHKYWFNLNANDSTANVTYRTTDGDVQVLLEGGFVYGPSTTANRTASLAAGRIRNWSVQVEWRWGTPARYTLEGDIVVN